jgi:DNA-binding GntR family transcriptional regulator
MAVYFPRMSGRPRAIRGAAEASDRAYQRLHALIVNGSLTPGSPLVETDLTASLAVSRTPVRAALLRLEQEGLVVRRTPRGSPGTSAGGRAFVAPLTADDLREVFLMIGALEATAVRQAAALEPRRREALAAVLEESNRGLRAAVGRRPPDLALGQDLHVRFHRALVAAAAGPRLQGEIDALAPQAERYERVYCATTMYAVDEFAAAHETIIGAVLTGDADAAERAAGADWRLTAERHCEMVKILGERGNW